MRVEKDLITEYGAPYQKDYDKILEQIKKFDRIAIFRHIMPDFDALGTQFGLATWIKDNFPSKEVKVLGDNHSVFTQNGVYPATDKLKDEWFNESFLAIIVDVGNKKRIADPRFERATYKIKIDHHPATEDYLFHLPITNIDFVAAAEFVVNMICNFKGDYKLSKKAASYFYTALVGDSGRFQYSGTTSHTFKISSILCEAGIDLISIYETMYQKNIADLDIIKFILNTYKVSHQGVAYYVFTNDDLKRFNLTVDRGKENVNLFSSYNGIKIWCSITEDVSEPCFRISIRSRRYVINGIAAEFKGGGHASASGAEIKDLTELPKFIEALDNLIIETDKINK